MARVRCFMHSTRRKSIIVVAMCVVASIAGAGAAAAIADTVPAAASYQEATLKFTQTEPGRPSGLALRVDYVNPDDPDGKPPAVRKVVQTLARGARIDTGAPALCTATDAELILLGPSACPAGSVVGRGVITLDTGLPDPARFLTEQVTFLNNTGELILVTQDSQTGARLVTRAQVEGRRITTEAPPLLPGAPPDGMAIDVVRADLRKIVTSRGGERRSYITTPARCPTSGHWVNTIEFSYDDGTQSERTRSRCRR